MEQQTTWFYYAVIFVVGMAAGAISLTTSNASISQTAIVVSR